jgi:putative exporter of polyketide antibiotics
VQAEVVYARARLAAALALTAVAAALVALGVIAFRRRDVAA